MLSRNELMVELEKQIGLTFKQMSHEMKDLFKDEITRNEFFILKFLVETGPQIASAISKEFEVSASHITAVTDNLVKKGLISRQRSEQDRRIVQILVTDAGINLIKRMGEKKKEFLFSKFSSLSDEEIQSFILLFKKITTDR